MIVTNPHESDNKGNDNNNDDDDDDDDDDNNNNNNLKCTFIPVIIEATGIVTRSLRKNLEAVPGKHSIDSLQRQLYLNITHNTKSTAM
jgi:hypothetical protein